MTTPRSPEGELLDIMELDQEIEQLRLGSGSFDDRALALLLELRDEIDERAAALLGSHDAVRGDVPVPVGAPAPVSRLRHRLAVVPLTGALLLASTGVAAALSGSPHAAFYPLHRLIFGSAAPSTATRVEQDLTAAQQLLNQAAAEAYARRGSALGQAHVWLSDAQRLLPRAGSQTHTLSIRLSTELALLATLEKPPVAGKVTPSPAPSEGTGEASSGPEAASSDGAAETGPQSGAGESEAPEPGGIPAQGLPIQTEPSGPVAEPSDSSWAPPSAGPTATHTTETDDPPGSETDTPLTSASPGTDR